MELKPVNKYIDDVTIEQIEDHKLISQEELNKDLENLFGYDASENRNNFYGNPFLYHFQFKNLIKCHREGGDTIYDIYNDKDKWNKLIDLSLIHI